MSALNHIHWFCCLTGAQAFFSWYAVSFSILVFLQSESMVCFSSLRCDNRTSVSSRGGDGGAASEDSLLQSLMAVQLHTACRVITRFIFFAHDDV